MASQKWTRNQKLTFWSIFITTLLSASGLALSIKNMFHQNNIEERLNYLHIDPELNCFLYQDNELSYFTIKNNSPINVVALSVDYITYGYLKDKNEYSIAMSGGGNTTIFDSMGKYWIFRKKLEPNEKISEFVGQLGFGKLLMNNIIAVRVFNVEYYRESDMKKYNKRIIFFLDGDKFYTYSEALKVVSLQKPIEKLEDFIRNNEAYTKPLGYLKSIE